MVATTQTDRKTVNRFLELSLSVCAAIFVRGRQIWIYSKSI
jgi:hypothetical protein